MHALAVGAGGRLIAVGGRRMLGVYHVREDLTLSVLDGLHLTDVGPGERGSQAWPKFKRRERRIPSAADLPFHARYGLRPR